MIELSVSEYMSFMKNLKKDNFFVYSGMVAMSSAGRLAVRQDDIGNALGISRDTVLRRAKDLREFIIEGQPLLRVVKELDSNVYYLTLVGTSQSGGHVTNSLVEDTVDSHEVAVKEHPCSTPKGVVLHFAQYYQEVFSETYTITWKRDPASVKRKLLTGDFDPEVIKQAIENFIRLYPSMYAKAGYPRPTIGAFVSWGFIQAQGYVAKNVTKERAAVEDEFENVEIKAMDDDEWLAQFDKFNV